MHELNLGQLVLGGIFLVIYAMHENGVAKEEAKKHAHRLLNWTDEDWEKYERKEYYGDDEYEEL